MKDKLYLTQSIPSALLGDLHEHCELVFADPPQPLRAQNCPDALVACCGLICLLTDTIDQALLDQLPNLEFVSSVSVGVDHVDTQALTARGIALGHTPGVLVDATADTAFALLLSAARRVGEADRFVREGQWNAESAWSPGFFLGKDVAGAALGLVGLGPIGQAMAKRAAGFGMEVLAWNRSPKKVAGVTMVSLDELLERSDFVSLHIALNDETKGLLGAARLAQMKPGSVLVNTARGGIVDEEALASVLESGHLYAAALDVFENEPIAPTSPLLAHPRVVFTPHIGSATPQTRMAMVNLAVANAMAALQGKAMPHCFNPQVYTA